MSYSVSTNTYDDFPYPSHPLPQAHPDHLATMTELLGLATTTLEDCRVVEPGCASGGNLIPSALTRPLSQFVGIDLSSEQIGEGLKTVEALGLTNIELRCLSILDVGDDFGEFDHIICHGVYLCVSRDVHDKIMEICARHLATDGIGYISFNTLPGWNMRGMIRDMMFYHVHRFEGETLEQSAGRARALLDFLTRSVPSQQSHYGLMLKQHLELLQKHSDSYLFHEFLEEHNEPVVIAATNGLFIAKVTSTIPIGLAQGRHLREALDTLPAELCLPGELARHVVSDGACSAAQSEGRASGSQCRRLRSLVGDEQRVERERDVRMTQRRFSREARKARRARRWTGRETWTDYG